MFRRVEDAHAGPTALGILVPPGVRTVVVLRPRSLDWDLLAIDPVRGFCQFGRDEAAGVARRVLHALEEAGVAQSEMEPVPLAHGFHARLCIAEHTWIFCRRRPGKPYEPWVFPSPDRVQQAIGQILAVLCPAETDVQEYYFNTQNFSR
jgi:hypothetical protein